MPALLRGLQAALLALGLAAAAVPRAAAQAQPPTPPAQQHQPLTDWAAASATSYAALGVSSAACRALGALGQDRAGLVWGMQAAWRPPPAAATAAVMGGSRRRRRHAPHAAACTALPHILGCRSHSGTRLPPCELSSRRPRPMAQLPPTPPRCGWAPAGSPPTAATPAGPASTQAVRLWAMLAHGAARVCVAAAQALHEQTALFLTSTCPPPASQFQRWAPAAPWPATCP